MGGLIRTFLRLALYSTITDHQGVSHSEPSSLHQTSTRTGHPGGDRSPSPEQTPASDPHLTCGPSPKFCTKSRYRSIDGSCNNLQIPNWGAALTPYVRLTKQHYADGIHEIPKSVTGAQLPNARELSFRIFLNKHFDSSVYNLNAAQWGQIITHDMSLTTTVHQINSSETCCDDQGQLPGDTYNTSICAPIIIPPNDPIYTTEGRQCLSFTRTGTTKDKGCTAPDLPAEPLTSVTAFMDLSLVYGNSDNQTDSLRTKTGGRMLSLIRNGQEWPPQQNSASTVCTAQSENEPCYVGGDVRLNQNLQLTALQVILLRNHNRIAKDIAHLNPHWNDELLFQETRRINIAQIQHINYYEYLPILLGFKQMVQKKLIYPGAVGYVNDYDPNVNPSILNEHATAALRHCHTLLRGFLKRVSEDRQLAGILRFSDWMNKPAILETNNTFDELTRGLTVQNMSLSDQYWTSELTNYLSKGNRTYGDDLRALDIQRGRDHGLGSYVATRAACELPVPKTFESMKDYISEENVALLQSFYASPEDVDLVVAGSLERPVHGAMAGPTFLCIWTIQFYRTRVGDRYFYENGADPDIAFTPAQLETIRKGANMARLLCDNTKGIHHMQLKAFKLVSKENPILPCDQLPFIDLTLWREGINKDIK